MLPKFLIGECGVHRLAILLGLFGLVTILRKPVLQKNPKSWSQRRDCDQEGPFSNTIQGFFLDIRPLENTAIEASIRMNPY